MLRTFYLFSYFLLLQYSAPAQSVKVRPADEVSLPAISDSNSPAFWLGDSLNVFQSTGISRLSRGDSQYNLPDTQDVELWGQGMPTWMESVWMDDEGILFGWYHTERFVCDDRLSWPQIGAAVSFDYGKTFFSQGIVLDAPGVPDCEAANGYFAGGHGDFTVLLDASKDYFYFYFGQYGGEAASQGVAMARLAIGDRWMPSGRVWKYYQGEFEEPGLGGKVTPIFPVAGSWNSEAPDALWGPSLHWNSYLNQYVMLLTRTCCESGWPTEGTYISFNRDLGNPNGWSAPEKILDSPEASWYPQVLGTALGDTDREAGRVARLYIGGVSRWELIFRR